MGGQYSIYLEIISMVIACGVMALLLAVIGAPLIAVNGQRLATARKRVMYNKAGRQVADLAYYTALATLPFTAGLWILSWCKAWFVLTLNGFEAELPPFSDFMGGEAGSLLVLVYVLALTLLVYYRNNWPKMKEKKGAHMSLGYAVWIISMAALFVIIMYRRTLVVYPEAFFMDKSLVSFMSGLLAIGPLSAFWPLAALGLFAAIPCAGGVGLCYLLIRREEEDFGRDYYSFALGFLAKWAYVGGLLTLLPLGWFLFTLYPLAGPLVATNQVLIFLAASPVLLLTASTLWITVARSKTPLRMKPSIVCALLLLIGAMISLGLAVMQISIFT